MEKLILLEHFSVLGDFAEEKVSVGETFLMIKNVKEDTMSVIFNFLRGVNVKEIYLNLLIESGSNFKQKAFIKVFVEELREKHFKSITLVS